MGIISGMARSAQHELRTLRGILYRRLAGASAVPEDVQVAFHQVYFEARNFNLTWRNTHYLGYPTLKCPLDLWLYQELIHTLRPSVIIETGTAFGGSAMYLASVCQLIDHGRVMTIDLTPQSNLPQHERIQYLSGSSVSPEIMDQVKAGIDGSGPVMVILDSDHAKAHVDRELELYHPLVTVGSYLVVEDANLNGHPVMPDHGPGPWEACEQFCKAHPEFEHDSHMDKFLLTFNPRGFLKRLR
jgi:cephalosporin hydroxylase